jgi:hypothetical protein
VVTGISEEGIVSIFRAYSPLKHQLPPTRLQSERQILDKLALVFKNVSAIIDISKSKQFSFPLLFFLH